MKNTAASSYPYAYYPAEVHEGDPSSSTIMGYAPPQQTSSFFASEQQAYDNGLNNDNEGWASPCLTWRALVSMLFFLACTFFTILVIYALVTNNTETVKTACSDLYPYMVTRTALSFCVFFAMCTFGLVYGPTQQPERNTVLVFFFLIYFVVLAIWGAVVVTKGMVGNSACYNALYDNTFHIPLLGDLGWIYVVVDVFYALCTVLIILRTQFTLNTEDQG